MERFLAPILSNWHFTRILQLLMGLTSLGYGIYLRDSAYSLVGGILLLQAIFNISLCGAAGCGTSSRESSKNKPRIEVGKYKPKI